MSDSLPAADIAGMAGGVVSVLTILGSGCRWLFIWRDKRAVALDARIETRLLKLETDAEQFRAAVDRWRVAFKIVADELARLSPGSPKLAQARRLLLQAFPTDPFVPPEMSEILERMP